MADQQDPKDQKTETPAPVQEQAPAPEVKAEPAEQSSAPGIQEEPPASGPAAGAESVSTPAPVEGPAPVSTPAPVEGPAPESPKSEQKGETPAKDGVVVPEFMTKGKEQPPTQPEERIWALIAYVPLVALISLIMKPDSDFVKLHGRQGLLLVVIFFVAIFFYVIPFVGPVIMLIIHLLLIVIGLFSMYQAYIGNWWKIPVLGDVAHVIPVEALTKVTRTAVMSEKVDKEKRKAAGEAEESSETSAEPEESSSEQQPSETPRSEKESPKGAESGGSNDQTSG